MRTLVWSTTFVRAFRRAVRRQPELVARVECTLKQLAEDPFHPTLHSHKLKGQLVGAWACTVDYDNRILFEFVQNPNSGEEEILLLTMGTHDEVY
ncbi:MAG: type II toxin-antitoxin system mRNA interferase toxin, RelE/StbE family [Synergistota bacterium]|nr:type II toxin-antitoxin system mRNA interferase toxin, RelE/StbE family [Synergistota bacterium]